jgi:hypothetical protein
LPSQSCQKDDSDKTRIIYPGGGRPGFCPPNNLLDKVDESEHCDGKLTWVPNNRALDRGEPVERPRYTYITPKGEFPDAMQGFCGGAIKPTVWPVVYIKFRGRQLATVIAIISSGATAVFMVQFSLVHADQRITLR